jgi:hypothetical protein
MVQVKTFTDSLYKSAIAKANEFLAELEPGQYIDMKFAVVETGRPYATVQQHIAVVYRKPAGGIYGKP